MYANRRGALIPRLKSLPGNLILDKYRLISPRALSWNWIMNQDRPLNSGEILLLLWHKGPSQIERFGEDGLLKGTFNFPVVLNSSCNIFIYTIFGEKFQRQLWRYTRKLCPIFVPKGTPEFDDPYFTKSHYGGPGKSQNSGKPHNVIQMNCQCWKCQLLGYMALSLTL